MTLREAVYGLLALAGLVTTWYFSISYAMQGGSLIDIDAAARLAFANPISSSLSADVLVAFVTFALWAGPEALHLGMRAGWVYPLLGWFIAFAFAYPLFLLRRERHPRMQRH